MPRPAIAPDPSPPPCPPTAVAEASDGVPGDLTPLHRSALADLSEGERPTALLAARERAARDDFAGAFELLKTACPP